MLRFYLNLYKMFENSNSMEVRDVLINVSKMATENLDFRYEYEEEYALLITSLMENGGSVCFNKDMLEI